MSPTSVPVLGTGEVELVIDTTSPVSACDQVRQQVRAAVHLGHLPAGSRLPTVRHLAGRLGVSNGVVARAYRALEEEGLLRTAGRGGTTVAAAPTDADIDLARRHALALAAADYATTASTLGVTREAALEAAREAMAERVTA